MVNLQIGIPEVQIKDITPITVCKELFTVQQCSDLIISQGQSSFRPDLIINEEKKHFKYLDSNALNPAIPEILGNSIVKINFSRYGFDITEIDAAYFLENKLNNYPDWYVDLGKDDLTTTRKLTVLIFLSPLSDYQGGELSILLNRSGLSYEQGTAVIFPSFQLYKFEPVIKGTQHIFVCWACGPAFH